MLRSTEEILNDVKGIGNTINESIQNIIDTVDSKIFDTPFKQSANYSPETTKLNRSRDENSRRS